MFENMLENLRSGAWLTVERLRVYGFILIGLYIAALIAWGATAHGLLDWLDRPLGTDFSEVWVSGGFVLNGHPERPFENDLLFAAERAAFGARTAIFAWGYPPFFLGLAAFLALFPYMSALFIWQAGSGLAYLAVMRKIVPRREVWLLAAAFPAVFVNLTHGHNGFLTAALMAGGLLALKKRPVLAGMLFALLVYKPQYGLLIPLALLCGGFWRAFLAATLGVIGLTLATLMAWGPAPWAGFFASLKFSRVELLEQGNTGFYKLQSLFAAVRMLGGPVELAYAAQGLLVLALAASIALLWWHKTDWRLRSAALLVAAILATPYCLDYDMMIVAPALGLMAADGLERGFMPYEKTLLVMIWLTPLFARTLAEVSRIPLGLISMLLLYGLILARVGAARRR